MRVISILPPQIVAATFACGIGVILRPEWATNNLWPLDGAMESSSSNGRGKKGVRDAISACPRYGYRSLLARADASALFITLLAVLILSTGFCFGAVVAFILNALIPIDKDQPDKTVHLHHYKQEDKAVPQEKLEA
jgi:hypothetical protein